MLRFCDSIFRSSHLPEEVIMIRNITRHLIPRFTRYGCEDEEHQAFKLTTAVGSRLPINLSWFFFNHN